VAGGPGIIGHINALDHRFPTRAQPTRATQGKAMKNNAMTSLLLAMTLAVCEGPAVAQPFGGGGPPPGSDPFLVKLFGKVTAFSATAEMSTEGMGAPAMEMTMSMLDGKTRNEVDMTRSRMPAQAVAQMKQMGMDKVVMLGLPAKQEMLVIYPGLQAYAEQAYNGAQASTASSDAKIETTSLGSDTIDNHACDKSKVVVTDKDGNKHEATVWYATDLKRFPIQIQMAEPTGGTATMKFKDVKFDKPDASLFDAPAGYTKYSSVQELMQTEVMKRLGGGGGPPK
jgi:hypothetical protein